MNFAFKECKYKVLFLIAIERLIHYSNMDLKWNLLIIYSPEFLDQYFNAVKYIEGIISSMAEDDMISILT